MRVSPAATPSLRVDWDIPSQTPATTTLSCPARLFIVAQPAAPAHSAKRARRTAEEPIGEELSQKVIIGRPLREFSSHHDVGPRTPSARQPRQARSEKRGKPSLDPPPPADGRGEGSLLFGRQRGQLGGRPFPLRHPLAQPFAQLSLAVGQGVQFLPV